MPSSRARSAPTRSPRNRNSLAKRGPICHGWAKYSTPGMPICTTGSAKNASSEAIDQVAGPGEHQPAGDAGALHHGDRRLGQLAPAPAHADVDLGLAGEPAGAALVGGVVPPQGRPAREGLVDVAARACRCRARREVLALAGEHDDLHLVVVGGAVVRVVEGVGHLGVLRVAVLRAVHRDDRDGPPALVPDWLVLAHGAVLSVSEVTGDRGPGAARRCPSPRRAPRSAWRTGAGRTRRCSPSRRAPAGQRATTRYAASEASALAMATCTAGVRVAGRQRVRGPQHGGPGELECRRPRRRAGA